LNSLADTLADTLAGSCNDLRRGGRP